MDKLQGTLVSVIMFSNYIISAKRDPTRVFFLDFNFLYLRGLKCSLYTLH